LRKITNFAASSRSPLTRGRRKRFSRTAVRFREDDG
jgi:hypothetical protein